MKEVAVIIPIYKSALSGDEILSLRQCISVLGKYPLIVIKPASLDLKALTAQYPQLQTVSFKDDYFRSIHGYNSLMLSREFYKAFIDYRYILIYQLDAYVFKDELKEWCEKDYDYVGAPWPVRPIYSHPLMRLCSWIKKQYCTLFKRPNSQITNWRVGNGGLSLRKVSVMLDVLEKHWNTAEKYLRHSGNHMYNEDVFFAVEPNRQCIMVKYPTWKEALEFSFDKYPDYCYRLNGNRLPFGCHGWNKKRMRKFWEPIIGTQAGKEETS